MNVRLKSILPHTIIVAAWLSIFSNNIALAANGCYAANERPATVPPSGFKIPDLKAERNAYRSWGWTWSADAEPSYTSAGSYSVSNPSIHSDTEGDDLWSYTMMYLRTGQNGYLERAQAWARYYKEDFRNCIGNQYNTFCRDRDGFSGDHMYGWGLIAWYQQTGDQAALTEAENLAATLEGMYADNNNCLSRNACTGYGIRALGRQLLLATRVAEVTGKQRWIDLRDKIINIALQSEYWDETQGMYFRGEWSTDDVLGAGSYAAGARIQSSMQTGVLSEALDHAYRTTGRQELRDRIVAIAKFVYLHGIDAKYQYTGNKFGIVNGKTWHNYSATEPVTFWDPVYTTSLVNTLMRGYRYTCDIRYYQRAKHHYERGNKGIYGEAIRRTAADNVVDHFVDNAPKLFYLKYNKGELQYTYLLFQPAPNVIRPLAPALQVQ